MSVQKLVKVLKQNSEDHEFYPTTDEIIKRMIEKCGVDDWCGCSIKSVLDIGAGNGKVLLAFKALKHAPDLYAIEKSLILCGQLSKLAFVVGTDFREQSLLSKEIDLTFCNPPYSEFEQWAVKIIRESASILVYLVLPERWTLSTAIRDALEYREVKAVKILGFYSFEDSEDRPARAKVNLIQIVLRQREDKDEAFNRFFNLQFGDLKARFEQAEKPEEPNYTKKDPKFQALVGGKNILEALVSLYDADMARTKKNFDLAGALDVDLLRELHVTPKDILACLKTRLTGLKQEYWRELFSHMEAVTNRLCVKKRNALLGVLNANGHVDFTAENSYAVLMWILNNANQYIDEQLIETFEVMVSKANVKRYKSNVKPFTEDSWRYNQEKPTHVALEYRIVLEYMGGIDASWSTHRFSDRTAEFLGDLLTVAHNLGFMCNTQDSRLFNRECWKAGTAEHFYCTINGERDELLEVRAFMNHNVHIRMNQGFALALNVEHGRLKGWLKNPKQATEELNDLQAAACFGICYRLIESSVPMLAERTA